MKVSDPFQDSAVATIGVMEVLFNQNEHYFNTYLIVCGKIRLQIEKSLRS
jgi:hypothetical protein